MYEHESWRAYVASPARVYAGRELSCRCEGAVARSNGQAARQQRTLPAAIVLTAQVADAQRVSGAEDAAQVLYRPSAVEQTRVARVLGA